MSLHADDELQDARRDFTGYAARCNHVLRLRWLLIEAT
jgi:hypothetical protein